MIIYKHTVTDQHKFKWEFYAEDLNNQTLIEDLTEYSIKRKEMKLSDFIKYIMICNFDKKEMIFYVIWILVYILLHVIAKNYASDKLAFILLNTCYLILLTKFIKDVLGYILNLLRDIYDYINKEVTILMIFKKE